MNYLMRFEKKSENYKKAQEYLNKLAKELDPSDENTEISKMIGSSTTLFRMCFPILELVQQQISVMQIKS